MNEINTKTLFSKYPNLYAGKDLSARENLMCFGFACGDGWFKILDNLSSKLEKIIVKYKRENKDAEPIMAMQVKEKFGGLRFYMSSVPSELYDEIYGLINEAELKASTTCEECGARGKLRRGGWIRNLCDAHAGGKEEFSFPDDV